MSYTDESGRLYIGREFTPQEFREWFSVQELGSKPFNAVSIHHTAIPTEKTWNGVTTLNAIFDWYRYHRGWPAGKGPHIFIYAGNGPYKPGQQLVYVATHPAHDGIAVSRRNHRWLAIEAVGNFDGERMPRAMEDLYRHVLHTVCGDRIPLVNCAPGVDGPAKPLGLLFHRDAKTDIKSCPGWTTTADWFFESMRGADSTAPEPTQAPQKLFKDCESGSRVPRATASAARIAEAANIRRNKTRESRVLLTGPEEDVRVLGWDRGETVGGNDVWYLVKVGFASGNVPDQIGWCHSSVLLTR